MILLVIRPMRHDNLLSVKGESTVRQHAFIVESIEPASTDQSVDIFIRVNDMDCAFQHQ